MKKLAFVFFYQYPIIVDSHPKRTLRLEIEERGAEASEVVREHQSNKSINNQLQLPFLKEK